MFHAIVATLALLGLAGVAEAAPAAPVKVGDLTISGLWTTATPPGAPTASGYLTVTNAGTAADRLLAVTSPLAASAMLHDMSIVNGIASMRMVDGIDIPAGKTVRLAPDGFHVMFETMKQPLQAGGTLPVTLTFQKAGKVDLTLPVLAIGARGPAAQ